MSINLENIYFILVEPRTAGNVGAACRAIKTMGFSHMRVVNPQADVSSPEAQWMAHGADDILNQIEKFDSIAEATRDLQWTVGTTNRERGLRLPFYTAEEFGRESTPLSWDNKIGVLFGREKTGLTNEELYFCNAVAYIPAYNSYPSLNLSQAVQVFAYELYKSGLGDKKKYKHRMASQEQIHILYERLKRVLAMVEFAPKDNMDTFVMRFQRWFGRSHPEERDVNVLHMIFKSIEKHIEHLQQEKKE